MDIDIKNIKIKALRGVLSPTEESSIRQIQRWYSKTFFTPLPVVETLDIEDVFTAFFETSYAEMSSAERREEALDLVETFEEKLIREQSESEEMDQLAEIIQKRAKKRSKIFTGLLEEMGNLEELIKPKKTEEPEIIMKFDDEEFDDTEFMPVPVKR